MSLIGSDPFPAPVELQLLGGASILLDGKPPERLPPRNMFAIFAILLFSPGYRCARVRIANDVWPEAEGESLRLYNLRRALTMSRKSIRPHYDLLIQPVQDFLQLNLDRLNVDVITFDECLSSQDPARIEAALRLYRGPLLAGFDEPWITHERQKRQSAYLRGIGVLRSAARESNNIRRVIDLCRLAIKADPTLEREQRELIVALADSGDVDAASQAYKQYEKALQRELGLEPEAEMRDLHKRIVMGAWEKSRFPAELHVHDKVTIGEFYRPLTPIVGRSAETGKLCSLVRANRLVTITAAGGFGKTRLALHLAETMNVEFEGGIWFVDLASVTDPSFVLPAIMDRFDVKDLPGVSRLQVFKTRLQALPTMIILDNCEHLRDACGTSALILLTGATKLHVLATSRQSLGVTGEALFRLGPLAAPEIGSGICADFDTETFIDALLDALQEQFPALSLFVQRARAHGAFELNSSSIAAVTRICARLEGNALALEIAAVQTRMYSVEDLDRSLDDLFGTLVTTNPTVKPRQRTLKALIGWSFDLLPESEAQLLARLSVFRGTWTLATVTEVCSGAGIDQKSVPTLVSNLADKSLIETLSSGLGPMRFKLLEMVRVYAQEMLDAQGEKAGREAARITDSFLDYYLKYALRLKMELTTNDQPRALDQMEQERDNLRTALELGIARADAVVALKLANSMWRYWSVRGYYSEGLAWFDRALSVTPPAGRELICESLFHAGNIAYTALRLSDARLYYDRFLELETEQGDPVFVASVKASLALVMESEGAYNEALELLDKPGEVLKRLGKHLLVAVCQSNMANNYVGLEDYISAIRLYREAIGLFRRVSQTSDFTHAMVSYSGALAMNGDIPDAVGTLHEVLPLISSLGSVNDLPRALLVYACIAVQCASFDVAACILGAYTSYNDKRRLIPTLLQRKSHDRDVAATRAALGSTFQAHFDRGYELTSPAIEQYLQKTFH